MRRIARPRPVRIIVQKIVHIMAREKAINDYNASMAILNEALEKAENARLEVVQEL